MIPFYILGGVALLLNIAGRILILRRDQNISDGWLRALKLLPGADLLYLMFRWEHARAGCIVCGLSIAMLVPAAHRLLEHHAPQHLAGWIAPSQSAGTAEKDAELKKRVDWKERKLAEVNRFLGEWYTTLSGRQAALAASPADVVESYNREAAAYQQLMKLWKAEREQTNSLKARL